MYLRFVNGLFYTSSVPKEGYKQVIMTESPTVPDGKEALYYWQEESNSYTQTWEIVDINNEPTEEEFAEAGKVLMGYEHS